MTEARVGVLRVSVEPNGAMKTKASGNLSSAEWIFAFESLKARLIQRSQPATVLDIARQVDKEE